MVYRRFLMEVNRGKYGQKKIELGWIKEENDTNKIVEKSMVTK